MHRIILAVLLGTVVGLTVADPGYFFEFYLEQAGQNNISTQVQLGDSIATIKGNDTYPNATIVGSKGTLHIAVNDAETGEQYLNKTLALNKADFGIRPPSKSLGYIAQLDPAAALPNVSAQQPKEPVYTNKGIMLDKMPRLRSNGHAYLDAYVIFTPPRGKSFRGVTGIYWKSNPSTKRYYTAAKG